MPQLFVDSWGMQMLLGPLLVLSLVKVQEGFGVTMWAAVGQRAGWVAAVPTTGAATIATTAMMPV